MKSLLFSLLGEWQPKTRFDWTRTLIELASNLMCVYVSLDCRWAAELANFRSSMCGEWVGKMRTHLMPTFWISLRFPTRNLPHMAHVDDPNTELPLAWDIHSINTFISAIKCNYLAQLRWLLSWNAFVVLCCVIKLILFLRKTCSTVRI